MEVSSTTIVLDVMDSHLMQCIKYILKAMIIFFSVFLSLPRNQFHSIHFFNELYSMKNEKEYI